MVNVLTFSVEIVHCYLRLKLVSQTKQTKKTNVLLRVGWCRPYSSAVGSVPVLKSLDRLFVGKGS